jgi:DNA gyrase/topoisomerase IV subunit A
LFFSVPKTRRKRQAEVEQKGTTKIVVRNIPFQANKKEIAELFR